MKDKSNLSGHLSRKTKGCDFLTNLEDDGGVSVFRNVPEGNVDCHGAEEEGHAAGDSLSTCERATPGRVNHRHPDVLVPEPKCCPILKDVPGRERYKEGRKGTGVRRRMGYN